MGITAFAKGTQTAEIGTEHFLADVDEVGTYTFHVNTVNMVEDDVLELRVKQVVLTGDDPEGAYFVSYSDAQSADDRIKISVPISNELTDAQSLRFSLKQTAGTGRAFKWKVLKHA